MNTYEVLTPKGSMVYAARTASKARYRAFLEYSSVFESRFGDFVKLVSVRKCPVPKNDGYAYVRRAYGVEIAVGHRVRIINEGNLTGTEGVVVYPGQTSAYVAIAIDGRDDPARVHPMSVERVAA
ncbi:MAG: hypothetical protein AAF468_12440 [Pseudomonadota bacterium]